LAQVQTAHLDAPDVYAIKDAKIITGNGKTIAKGTVIIRDGLIADVGENVRIPADARVVEAAGMTVYPGLIDGLTNLGLPAQTPQRTGGGGPGQAPPQAAAQQQQPEAGRGGDPDLSAADQLRPGGTTIEDARSAGVTAALTTPRQGIFSGQSALINLAGEEASKMVVRAPVALTVQFSAGGGFGGGYPNSLMGTVAYIRQTFYDATRYRDEHTRFDRVKRGVPRPEHDKRMAALQPALRGEMPVLFIANSDGDIRRALMIADEFKLKPIIAGAQYSYRVVDMLKAKNIPVILSVDFPRRAADLPEDEEDPLRVLRDRADIPKGPGQLVKAGVKIAFTSGSQRPQDFIAGVMRAVENGLSKDDALKALTANAAEILGAGDMLGTIETGKIANLVVTSGDLLSREGRIRHVFIDGAEVELKRPETPQRGGGRQGGSGAPSASVDPSGNWELTVRSPQGDVNARLTLQREGDRITGTFAGPMGSFPIGNGSVTGNQLRLPVSVQFGGDTIEATIVATIEGDSMSGTISLGALGSFELSGTRPR
ncbi:MAG TPA: amidohydrolase family protein, partial [Blastocatellia bacterium]|nr:amidohydrolase family protein [Blastocatellia bacterium]